MSETLLSSWSALRQRLEVEGVDSPVLDARMLVEAGAGVSRLDIVTDPYRALSDAQVEAIAKLAARRIGREPMSHIMGRKGFWKFELAVGPSVLTPRPETETLVDLVLEQVPPDAVGGVADLGVGSGAILLAILSERTGFSGLGLDASLGALALAQANAQALGLSARVRFQHGEWEALEGGFDLIVSNPPYIRSADIDGLAPEVSRFEPRLALDGGADGLDAYRRILGVLPAQLKPGGLFALEVGYDQAEAVSQLAAAAGLQVAEPRNDLAGIARVVWGRAGKP